MPVGRWSGCAGVEHGLQPTNLGICEEFSAGTSLAVRRELVTLLRGPDITGGSGWLIDLLALTRRRQLADDGREAQDADR
jgi:hypothetical protein